MGVTSASGRVARARGDRADASAQPALAPLEAAWLAAIPCTLVTLAAILVLAPPIGRVLFPPKRYDFWPEIAGVVMAEPTEHTSYLLALGGVVALVAAVLVSALRPLRLAATARRTLVAGAQGLLAGFLVVCLVAQHRVLYGPIYTLGAPAHHVYFTWPAVGVAVVLALLVALALARAPAGRLAALLRETRPRHAASLFVAAGFTAIWLLTAINTDAGVGNVNPAVHDMLPWSLDETFAVLNGRTPLVDFHAQYGELWPYVVAATLSVAGTGLGLFTATMATIAGASLLAIFGVFRRVTRSSLAALLLFMPFLATSFFMERGPLENRYGPSNLFTIFPVRYGGPYLLAWLVSRHLDGRQPRPRWPLFLAGGLVVLNNPEFGAPALGATLVACLLARPPRSVRGGARLLGELAAGVLGAVLLVVLLTLARSGSLPHFALLFEFSKLYGLSGWAMLPMPHLGLHLIVFATFAGALALAAVRAASREEDAPMTGMLAWSGVFGLGTGVYFVGRSHPDVLIDLFSAWTFALALLVVCAVRAIAARPSRLPRAIELAVLAGFGLAACSIAQTPQPWTQVARIDNTNAPPVFRGTPGERFIRAHTRRGEHVAILNPAGHRIAYDLGLVNVSPYASSESIVTVHQMRATVRALRAAGGHTLFLFAGDTGPQQIAGLEAEGLVPGQLDRASATLVMTDRARR